MDRTEKITRIVEELEEWLGIFREPSKYQFKNLEEIFTECAKDILKAINEY